MLLDMTELLIDAPSRTPGRPGQKPLTFCSMKDEGLS
jgi:hypothetical protein